MLKAVFFDLDGTVADTAPDLANALNRLRAQHQLPPLPIEKIRPYASQGARGLLKIGFDLEPDHPTFNALREQFFSFYQQATCVETKLFSGILELFNEIEKRQLRWGIVTNKLQRFTVPLMDALGLSQRVTCIVSGDNVTQPKPHPASLLFAAGEVGVEPKYCLYIGDDERDALASRAAGMKMLVATYGYLGNGNPPETWHAEGLIQHPLEAVQFIDYFLLGLETMSGATNQ